ncbi:MAG: HEPN domain-containing protein [Dehalococcoidia bacterium]
MQFNEVQCWHDQAQYDLSDARYSATGGRHALACFLCHQAGEKIIVAYLYAVGAEKVWGHSLSDLCEDAMAFDASFDLVKSNAAHLDKHHLGARYPTGIPAGIPAESYDEIDSNRALAIAEEVIKFVNEKLKLLDQNLIQP